MSLPPAGDCKDVVSTFASVRGRFRAWALNPPRIVPRGDRLCITYPLAHRGKDDRQEWNHQYPCMEEYEPDSRTMGHGGRALGRDPATGGRRLTRWAPAFTGDRPSGGDAPREIGAAAYVRPPVYGEARSSRFGGPGPRGCRGRCLGAEGCFGKVPGCLAAALSSPPSGGS